MPQLLAGDGAFIDGDCLDGLNEWFDRVPRGNAVSLTVTRRQPAGGSSSGMPQRSSPAVVMARFAPTASATCRASLMAP